MRTAEIQRDTRETQVFVAVDHLIDARSGVGDEHLQAQWPMACLSAIVQ